jgi:hypothetical protein
MTQLFGQADTGGTTNIDTFRPQISLGGRLAPRLYGFDTGFDRLSGSSTDLLVKFSV